jgi:hypothetical protein
MPIARTCTAFAGNRFLARGPMTEVALAVKAAEAEGTNALVFADDNGRIVDLDLRGSDEEIAARFAPTGGEAEAPARGRGRPKLGVVAREVTLLPRHWEWLSRQRGGASHALRRLVDEARKSEQARGAPTLDAERAYPFLSAIAGNLPGFEEVSRALFVGDGQAYSDRMSGWPADIRRYALELSTPDADDHSPNG